jgi:hypothetical protein
VLDTPSCAAGTRWSVPHLITSKADLDKIDALLAVMASTKAAKQPQAQAEAKAKAVAKAKAAQIAKAAKAKAAPKKSSKKGKAPTGKKAPSSCKAGAKANKASAASTADEDRIEDFIAEIDDGHGNSRPTVFGDDLLNAINYTLENLQEKHKRPAAVKFALHVGVLFALDGKLDLILIQKTAIWTKARKLIKTYLNRVHALARRATDPDQPAGQCEGGEGGDQSATLGLNPGEGDDDDDDDDEDFDDEDEAAVWKQLTFVFRNNIDKEINVFLDDNMPDAVCNSLCFRC